MEEQEEEIGLQLNVTVLSPIIERLTVFGGGKMFATVK